MRRVKRWVAATVLSGSLAGGAGLAVPAVMASPAGAQPPDQVGLVNVNIEDVAVVVPINAAANICGVDVNVLSSLPAGTTFTDCDARSGQDVTVTV